MRLRPGPKLLSEYHEPGERSHYVIRPAGWWPWLIDVYYDLKGALRRWAR